MHWSPTFSESQTSELKNKNNRFVRNFVTMTKLFSKFVWQQNCGIHVKKSDHMFWPRNNKTYHGNAGCQLLLLYNSLSITCLSASIQFRIQGWCVCVTTQYGKISAISDKSVLWPIRNGGMADYWKVVWGFELKFEQ